MSTFTTAPNPASPLSPRAPLRARGTWRDLNRAYWSRGQVINPDRLERRQARQIAESRPVEAMSLQELARTQYAEPLSESRRCWLQTGAGALSLESLIERDAQRFGTPIAELDPITAKQIAWEQANYYTSPVVRFTRRNGRTVASRWLDPATFRKLQRRAREYAIGITGPRPRPRLTREAFIEARRRVRQWTYAEERRQQAHDPLPRDRWADRVRDDSELELGFDLCGDAELEALLGDPDEADEET